MLVKCRPYIWCPNILTVTQVSFTKRYGTSSECWNCNTSSDHNLCYPACTTLLDLVYAVYSKPASSIHGSAAACLLRCHMFMGSIHCNPSSTHDYLHLLSSIFITRTPTTAKTFCHKWFVNHISVDHTFNPPTVTVSVLRNPLRLPLPY